MDRLYSQYLRIPDLQFQNMAAPAQSRSNIVGFGYRNDLLKNNRLPSLAPIIPNQPSSGLVGDLKLSGNTGPTAAQKLQLGANNLYEGLGGASGIANIAGVVGTGLGMASDWIEQGKSQFDSDAWDKQESMNLQDYINDASKAYNTDDILGLASNTPDFLASLSDVEAPSYNLGKTLGSAAKGAAAGSMFGLVGTAIGGAARFIGDSLSQAFGMLNTSKELRKARKEAAFKENQAYQGLVSANRRVNNTMYRQNMANYLNTAAFGGPLHSHGADWDNDIIHVTTGGRHEENPYGGVLSGFDPNGVPNLVEEGEVIWDDYVFSDRLKAPKEILNKYDVGGKKDKSMTFAETAKELEKKIGIDVRPNDPISKRTRDAVFADLEGSQEEVRMKKQQKEIIKALSKLSPEEFAMVMQPQPDYQQIPQQMPQQQMMPQGDYQGLDALMQPEEQGLGVPGGYEGYALGGNKFDGKSGSSEKHVGTAKYGDEGWDKYSYSGVEQYFKNMLKRYNEAKTDADKRAVQEEAINTVRNIQQGYKDVYNRFNRRNAIYDDAVKAHQTAWNTIGGNTGFTGIDDDIDMPYTGTTTDKASEGFTPDGLFGWRTALRHMGSDEYGNASKLADIASQMGLNWTPELDYGENGNMLYLLSHNIPDEASTQEAAPAQTPVAPIETPQAPVTTPTVDVSGLTGITPEYEYLPTWMRYAPTVGAGLSVLTNMFDSPDYSGAEELLADANRLGRPVNIPVKTIGDYVRRNPFDERLMVNQANQNLAAAMRATRDNAGGNRAYRQFANASLAHNNQAALSDIARNAYLANRQDALSTAEFNRGTNQYNASAINQRNLAQAQLNSSRQAQGLTAKMSARQYLDNQRRADEQLASADLTAFLKSLGNTGRENFTRNQITSLAEQGALNAMYDKKGRWIFNPTTNTSACGGKKKTKKRRF